jgi:hypothetical protein
MLLESSFSMTETPQQYTQRILSNAEGQDPVKIQSETNKKLGRLIEGVPAAKLRKRAAPEKWSVAEILAHLADVEIVIGWRMRSILGHPGTNARPSIKTPGSPLVIMRSATPRNLSKYTVCCVRRILLSSNLSPPINGSSSANTPNAARNPSSTSFV